MVTSTQLQNHEDDVAGVWSAMPQGKCYAAKRTRSIELSAHARYNTLRQCVVQPKRVANGIHFLTNQQIGGLPQADWLCFLHF